MILASCYFSACLICFAVGAYVGIRWCVNCIISLEEKGVITIDMDLWDRTVKWKRG